ncbi:hypothetical protein CEP51_005460 [Fusarium floridanum]|uniref:Protein kinase domain-containing protein n=1 Tax=Fusarium floridanum TaxID=1325733 RepID=A0A428RWX3_9HYPO|nr:hypothetical protein CEP51_005460 [Fusarium floridanum]
MNAVRHLRKARSDLQEVLDFLDQSVAVCRHLTVQKEAAVSPDSPMSKLIHQQTKALLEGVYLYRDLIYHTVKSFQEAIDIHLTRRRYPHHFLEVDIPADLEANLGVQLRTVQRELFRFLILEVFHARNPETGRLGGLNALFASRFILQDDGGPGSISESLGPDGAQRILASVQNMMEAIGIDLSVDEAIQSLHKDQDHIQALFSHTNPRLHPRHVRKYQKIEDTAYNQNVAFSAAKGSFGFVHKVQRKDTGEILAMKTFFKGGNRTQILYEIGILEVCDHPNIPKLVEAFSVPTEDEYEDEDETINIVMSPWAPFTLQKFLELIELKRRAQCPWFRPGSPQSDLCIFDIMRQLADAIAYLHRKSIKHKDIKPDNILLYEPRSSPPHAIVADVGVSKVMVHKGSTNYNDSSYQYLAPEQVAEKDSSLPADVWQLGCCFALLLAVSKAGTLGYHRLWDSFCLTGSCQIASEHGHFMKSFGEIYLFRSRADRVAYSLVSSMLNRDHKARINIEGVLASVEDLIRQASEGGGRGVTMAG